MTMNVTTARKMTSQKAYLCSTLLTFRYYLLYSLLLMLIKD